VNGVGAAGLAIVIGSAKLGESALGGEGDTKGKNGLCAGAADAAPGNGGGLFEATGATSTAIVGKGGGPLRTGAAAAGLVGPERAGGAAGFLGPGLAGRGCGEASGERTRTDDSESNGGRGGAGRGAIAGRRGGLMGNVK
jgi:hypothetical protein